MNLSFSFSLFDRKARSREASSDALPKTGGQMVLGSAMRGPRPTESQIAAARAYREFNMRQLRAYDAAVTTNLNPDFIPTVGSANAEILTSDYIMVGRSRTLVKDYPTAKGCVRAFKNNVVGHNPFPLEMKVGTWSADGKTFELDTKTNRLIQEAWEDATLPENLTTRGDMGYMELCQMVEAAALRDGSLLFRQHRDFPYNKYGYALEAIETDRLQKNYTGQNADNRNEIRFSIERDRWNRPVAYWILNRHPGDLFKYNGFKPEILRERVDAADIIHFNNLRDRAEQDIGVPEFDSTIQTLHRNRQFNIAHATAATQSANKPWWIKKTLPTGMNYSGDPASAFSFAGGGMIEPGGAEGAQGDGKGRGVDKIDLSEPGTAHELDWGLSLEQLDPKFPIEAASAFRRDNHLDVACGTGLSYGSTSGDFEKYSFSVARFATLPERDNFMVRQEKMKVDFVRVHFNNWLKNAILSGALNLPISRWEEFCKAANFHGKRWPYIQPVQDVQADGIALELGIESPQGVMANSEHGKSFEDVCVENSEARKILEAHGLPIPGDATMPTIKKGEPGTEDTPQGRPEGSPPAKGKKAKLFSRVPASNGEHHEWR